MKVVALILEVKLRSYLVLPTYFFFAEQSTLHPFTTLKPPSQITMDLERKTHIHDDPNVTLTIRLIMQGKVCD